MWFESGVSPHRFAAEDPDVVAYDVLAPVVLMKRLAVGVVTNVVFDQQVARSFIGGAVEHPPALSAMMPISSSPATRETLLFIICSMSSFLAWIKGFRT